MPTYDNRGEYLLVEIIEPYTLGLYLNVVREVAKRCDTDGLHKVLVDFSLVEGEPSITDRFVIGKEVAQLWRYKIQGAGVARGETINYVMENVAVNRGAHVKAFTTRQAALQWLGISSTNA